MSVSWIALNSVNGLGAVTFAKLLDRFGSPESVFTAPQKQLIDEKLLSPSVAAGIHDPSLLENAQKQMEQAEHLGVAILTLTDSRYPSFLKEIFAPPPLLFALGNLKALSYHSVAIVGSRSPTLYGKQVTAQITRELVQHHFTIVSGLARGIDTIAHDATLEAGGATIAVLGCGIDNIYPHSNKRLAERICTNGLLISEFPFKTPPETYNFPRRNRIISGLSSATVVIEAGEKSGSLITARYALQQGREVCAVPGPINSPLSRGTFNLIREGATPVRSGHELAESLSVVTLPKQSLGIPLGREPDLTVLNDDERTLYTVLSDEPAGMDTIAETLDKPVEELFMHLLNLELKGFVQQCSGQQFIKVCN